MKGFMYILECADGSYYTGSTTDLQLRFEQHQNGEGANHTKKRLPVKLVYFEEFQRIDEAFHREKQVQGWSRKKKEALIDGNPDFLPQLSVAYRDLNGGFESLSHRDHSAAPEALEGNAAEAKNQPHGNGGFESLNHRDPNAVPEALEGSATENQNNDHNNSGFENLSHRDPKAVPEALEGNATENQNHNHNNSGFENLSHRTQKPAPEALEGGETGNQNRNRNKGGFENLSHRDHKAVPEALEGEALEGPLPQPHKEDSKA